MAKKTGDKKPKNRLYRGSKYSEYKIDQVLKCFADDLSVKEAEEKTRINVRSLRPIYRKLRFKLFNAVRADNRAFGYAGMFLNIINRDDLETIRAGDIFQKRMKKHYPKAPKPEELKQNDKDSLNVTLLLIELIIRECSQFELVKDDDFDRRIVYLHKNFQHSGLERYIDWREGDGKDVDVSKKDKIIADSINLYEQMGATFGELLRLEMETLIGNAGQRPYSGLVVYRDLRKYLLKNPM